MIEQADALKSHSAFLNEKHTHALPKCQGIRWTYPNLARMLAIWQTKLCLVGIPEPQNM